MNSSIKIKRKRTKKVSEEGQIETSKDQQKIAAQSLFYISNFQDEFPVKKQLNPEADIFNSVHFHTSISPRYQNSTNKINFTHSPTKSSQVLQLQKYLDNKFIQQSKLLLKLYQSHPNQRAIQSPNKMNFVRQAKNRQQEANNIFANSFKSDSVFVVKRIPIKQGNKEKKILIKTQKSIPVNIADFRAVSIQKGNKILRISPLLQSYKKSDNWMTKSLQFGSLNDKEKRKFSLSQYAKIQNYKTLDNTITYKNQSYKKSHRNIIHTLTKYAKTDHNQTDSTSKQQRNSNSFRKRLTFYQNQKCKTNQKYQKFFN